MTEARLSTAVWVAALIRRANIEGASAFVVARGDAERGDVIVKIARLDGTAQAYRPSRDLEGQRTFTEISELAGSASEQDIDAYVQRARSYDSDLWVIEIEDPSGRHFITEPISG